MHLSLISLPLELLLNVVSYLNFEDFVSLSNTQRELASLLCGENTCQEVVKVSLSHFPSEAVL